MYTYNDALNHFEIPEYPLLQSLRAFPLPVSGSKIRFYENTPPAIFLSDENAGKSRNSPDLQIWLRTFALSIIFNLDIS